MALLAFVTFLQQTLQGFDTFRSFFPFDAVEFDVVVVFGVEGPGCEWMKGEDDVFVAVVADVAVERVGKDVDPASFEWNSCCCCCCCCCSYSGRRDDDTSRVGR